MVLFIGVFLITIIKNNGGNIELSIQDLFDMVTALDDAEYIQFLKLLGEHNALLKC